ncbi:MmcQ/YjbR family DNA-binding protein [Robertkochia marina]|uniref:MmcQ/YjbR family DNA-binding protein n=1 Tax=Robertkochia marina TaxID=1227945 RepID=A0A4V3UYB5_9FLAO|nr:MmcQ/YjbR family DNA-binding protein [Robertkochia marina]THD69068.1 MmcQ/YjbR family DNA-binding protein [Robertkochia marina]TRZ44892.1 MmcQ/YjbR family DNA-binding protein [Robertkochia marina]
MYIDQLRDHCLNKKGVTESFPFDEHTLVFKVMGKMFALIPLEKWEAGEQSVNLKCDPERSIELRETYAGVSPGFHMDKLHWNTVRCDVDVPPSLILELSDHSYELVVAKFPKKLKEAYDALS